MRYIIIHRVLYLGLCIAGLGAVIWPIYSYGYEIDSPYWNFAWRTPIIIILAHCMFKILRKTATEKTYKCELLFSRARLAMAILVGIRSGAIALYLYFEYVSPSDYPSFITWAAYNSSTIVTIILFFSPLVNLIWIPIIGLIAGVDFFVIGIVVEHMQYWMRGNMIGFFLSLLFIAGELIFLKQLKKNKHLFQHPVAEVDENQPQELK